MPSGVPKQLLDKFGELFADELVTITKFRATLDIPEDAHPKNKFHGARPIHFAISAAIDDELDPRVPPLTEISYTLPESGVFVDILIFREVRESFVKSGKSPLKSCLRRV